jgi:hypothetical protein
MSSRIRRKKRNPIITSLKMTQFLGIPLKNHQKRIKKNKINLGRISSIKKNNGRKKL